MQNKDPFRPKGWRDPNVSANSWWRPENTANKDSWWMEAEEWIKAERKKKEKN